MSAHQRIAVVTGAGSGIGKAAALALLEDGYQVVLVGRRIEPLQEVAAAAGDSAARAFPASGDISDAEAVAALFAQVKARYGRLDVLFNNAGVSAFAASIEDVPLEQWKKV